MAGPFLCRGEVVIPSVTTSGKKTVLSGIRKVQIDESVVSGEVRKQVITDGQEPSDPKWTPFRSNKDDNEQTVVELRAALERSKVDWNFSDGPSFLNQYGFLLLTLLAFFFIMMFVARRISGVGSPMSFGRSRGKALCPR